MLNFGCKGDIPVDSILKNIEDEVMAAQEKVGREAVDYAVANGTYRNVTGRLRASNGYKSSKDGLTLYNDAPYAKDIEARGEDVISGAALYAQKRLNEMS